ncbi:MAG: phosphoglucosamine mutase [Bacteroidales bacterium]
MTLIKSISGIRGTIGGMAGEGLTPLDIVKFVSAYSSFIVGIQGKKRIRIVLGRDARLSGEMVSRLVAGTLMGCGADVIDIGLATTPTVEMAVTASKADGGIILTASHNPGQWNALKLLNSRGEFLSAANGEQLLQIIESGVVSYAPVNDLGKLTPEPDFASYHISKVLEYPLVDAEAIRKAGFCVAIDAVNSVGGIVIPDLLRALGVKTIHPLYCDPNGIFPHNPEPLPEHLTDISRLVREKGADVGFVVDPDVDRLAIICEDGSMFGEEYTLVAIADYFLQKRPGNTVSNLSSSRALKDVTEKYKGSYTASAVGEVNVVEAMKRTNAVLGGEGNGGIIVPDLHYGRDALIGIALFLTALAKRGGKVSQWRKTLPDYVISKNKVELQAGIDLEAILQKVKKAYSNFPVNEADGVRIDFPDGWVHLRKSNTEPVIRIIAEGASEERARDLASQVMLHLK